MSTKSTLYLDNHTHIYHCCFHNRVMIEVFKTDFVSVIPTYGHGGEYMSNAVTVMLPAEAGEVLQTTLQEREDES